MTIDGRALAAEVNARTQVRAARLVRVPRVLAITAAETPATRSYLSIKEKQGRAAGCVFEVERFPETATSEELMLAVSSPKADAVIVQLPLPTSLEARLVCDAIPLDQDADVLSAAARARFERAEPDALVPPVAAAVEEILRSAGVAVAGKRALVIGTGFLVGVPVARWLMQHGAQVETATRDSGDLTALVRGAELIVSGAGTPRLITPDMLAEGAILIDAGTAESDGAIVGDADPACLEKCALFTPVPGGVGPVAVAKLFENVVRLAERKQGVS